MSKMKAHARNHVAHKFGADIWVGLFLVVGILGGTVAWASVAELSGAVIGQGSVIVESHGKRIQHADGGIVADIRVDDGSEVQEGDLLIRLDETITRANFAISEKGLDQAVARLARLEAERDRLPLVEFPPEIETRKHVEHIARAIVGERAMFAALSRTYNGKIVQLRERKQQLANEVMGYEAQFNARRSEIALLRTEMDGTKALVSRQYAPAVKMLGEQRQMAALEGDFGRLAAQIAQTNGKIAETELQVIQIQDEEIKRVATEIRDTERRIEELRERKVAAEDKLKRTEMRAPRTGVVHEMQVHTIGAVIRPGEVVLTVVPKEDILVVEARVRPVDIDQVSTGQLAFIRFPNFNRRTTPELNGRVVRVGADVAQDPSRPTNTGTADSTRREAFYPVRISVSEDELKRLNGLRLQPGMPAEVFIQTEDRTAISYMIKPISDQLARAFREK